MVCSRNRQVSPIFIIMIIVIIIVIVIMMVKSIGDGGSQLSQEI